MTRLNFVTINSGILCGRNLAEGVDLSHEEPLPQPLSYKERGVRLFPHSLVGKGG
jgi:hypothetical protein